MNDHLPVGSPLPVRETGRLDAVGHVRAIPDGRGETPSPQPPGDRTALGNHGNGRAVTAALFVMDLPPTSLLMGSQLAMQMAAEIAAAQHNVMPPQSAAPISATSVSLVIGSGNVGLAAAMLPEQLIGELSAGTMHLADEVFQAGAAVLEDGGVALRSTVIATNLEAATIAAEEMVHVPQAFVQVVVFDIGVREMAAQEAEIGHENLTAQAAGAAPVDLVVDVPTDAPTAATAAEPTPARPPVMAGPVGQIIARLQANRPSPTAAAPGQEQVRVRAGGSAISRMHAFARAYSRGDEGKFAEFQAAAIQAATSGLRLDDPKHGRAAAFLAGLARRHGDKLGNLIRVDNGVVRIDATAVSPAQLGRLLRHNSNAETIALESRKLARHLPGGQRAMGGLLALATSPQGVSLSDPKHGQAAQQLAAILAARPELADSVKIQDGHLHILLPADDARTLVEYFDYLTADDLPESVQKIRDANTASIETSSQALEAFESAQVFLTVYNNLERAQEAALPAERHPPRDDDDDETPPPPADGGEGPIDTHLPPAPEPQIEIGDAGEAERNTKANRRHNQAAAAALNASLLLNAQGERHLDEVKAGVETSAEARLAAIQQRLDRHRQEYAQALGAITTRQTTETHRRETVGVTDSAGSATPVAVDRENNLDYSRPVPVAGD